MDREQLTLSAGDARAVVNPECGGRIASLEVGGLELLVERDADPVRWGCYPMAPFAGRVRNGRFTHAGREYTLERNLPPHAIHGTVFQRSWQQVAPGRLRVDLGPGWPFDGFAQQHFQLDPDGLDLELSVHTKGEPFPASAGWHPWLRRRLARGGEAKLDFEADAMYRRDADHIPTGEVVPPHAGPWDDCFTALTRLPRIEWPGALRLAFDSRATHWVVYDEPAHALCVEPQSGPPDALRLAPRIVTRESPLVLRARLAWTRLT